MAVKRGLTMLVRLLPPLLAVLLPGLAAFAPAPLPRNDRRHPDRLTLSRVSGDWVIQKAELSTSHGGYSPTWSSIKVLRIEGGKWYFHDQGGRVIRDSHLTFRPRAAQAEFDLSENGQVIANGVLRLRGVELQALYRWGGPRPTNFETPPPGCVLLTFRRK
jgi:hypothetical protein